MLVPPAGLAGVEAGSVSAEEVEVAALAASAERVDAVVWALAWVLAQVLAAASVLSLASGGPGGRGMSPTFTTSGSIPSGMGSSSGCKGGVSPGCRWSGSKLGRGSPLGVRPGSGSLSPVGGTGSGSSSPCFFALFFSASLA